jgi:hypothetical protein
MKDFFQKELFLRWADRNRPLFSHTPYLLNQRDGFFTVGFRGVSKHISCHFSEYGFIEIRVFYRKTFYDIITEFDLHEEQTAEGRWVCGLCRDWSETDGTEPLVEYKDREELWIKHSFEPLAAWTQASFTPAAMLCLCRLPGCTCALVAEGARLKETEKRRDFFKKLPVLTVGKGKI